MSVSGYLVFCLVYLLAVATPGPCVTAVVARSLRFGLRGAPAFIGGFLLGDLLWFAAASAGLVALAHTAHALFLALRYAGALYLLYLAWRMWSAPPVPLAVPEALAATRPARLFAGSLALTLGNPKAMMFFIALLPTVVPLRTLRVGDYLLIGAAIGVIMPSVLGAYALAATRAREFFRHPRSLRLLNRGAGVAMAGAAGAVIAR